MRIHLPVLLQQATASSSPRLENDKVEELSACRTFTGTWSWYPASDLCCIKSYPSSFPFRRCSQPCVLPYQYTSWSPLCSGSTCVSTLTLAKPQQSDATLAFCQALPLLSNQVLQQLFHERSALCGCDKDSFGCQWHTEPSEVGTPC